MKQVNEERIKRNNPEIESITGLYDRDTRQRRRAAERAEIKKQVSEVMLLNEKKQASK